MDTSDLAVVSIPGLVARPIDTFDIMKLDTPDDEIELTFHGPEGPVIVTGDTKDVYRLVVSVELALRDFVIH